jgi:hypothetical protein
LSAKLTQEEFAVAQTEESKRLALLDQLGLCDPEPIASLDQICRLARRMFGVSVSRISFVDRETVWHKARIGDGRTHAERVGSPCDLVVGGAGLVVVQDARRRDGTPSLMCTLAASQGFRFFAAAPIMLTSGLCAGAISVADKRARVFDAPDREALAVLATIVQAEIWTCRAEAGLVACADAECRMTLN